MNSQSILLLFVLSTRLTQYLVFVLLVEQKENSGVLGVDFFAHFEDGLNNQK